MTASELEALNAANAETDRLMHEETMARARLTLEAELVASLYPNDPHLDRLRDAVMRYAEARKRTHDHMATELHQACLPFARTPQEGSTDD